MCTNSFVGICKAINCTEANIFSTLEDSEMKLAALWSDYMGKSHSATAAGGPGEEGTGPVAVL